ncbi:unnamed protein product [Tetraodon nigroviridis]|uniref:(spotted green pufferfish) hypothetical protein n=1 Tax=Tetraodon nigroviridis TaxID=99883 RepID=Q4SWN1_TETNG|nr:unnamed protein product [Tetraodon nigroviridis]
MPSKRSLQQSQDEVHEVDELSDLDDWPEVLQPEASQVESSADKLRRKYWWKNIKIWAKLTYILAVVTIIVLILLVMMWISPEKS